MVHAGCRSCSVSDTLELMVELMMADAVVDVYVI